MAREICLHHRKAHKNAVKFLRLLNFYGFPMVLRFHRHCVTVVSAAISRVHLAFELSRTPLESHEIETLNSHWNTSEVDVRHGNGNCDWLTRISFSRQCCETRRSMLIYCWAPPREHPTMLRRCFVYIRGGKLFSLKSNLFSKDRKFTIWIWLLGRFFIQWKMVFGFDFLFLSRYQIEDVCSMFHLDSA